MACVGMGYRKLPHSPAFWPIVYDDPLSDVLQRPPPSHLSNLHVGAVQCPNNEGSIHCKLHVRRPGGLRAYERIVCRTVEAARAVQRKLEWRLKVNRQVMQNYGAQQAASTNRLVLTRCATNTGLCTRENKYILCTSPCLVPLPAKSLASTVMHPIPHHRHNPVTYPRSKCAD